MIETMIATSLTFSWTEALNFLARWTFLERAVCTFQETLAFRSICVNSLHHGRMELTFLQKNTVWSNTRCMFRLFKNACGAQFCSLENGR